MFRKYLFVLSFILAGSIAYSDINLYGPGGPDKVLKELAEIYNKKTGVKVNVNFGPQATWNEKAKQYADILYGASELSGIAIANDHKENFSIYDIEPIFLRRAVILTKKGNPKNIKGLKDLASKNIRVVVPDGMGISNTSGTGVWEDMIGRTQDIELVKKLRKNIVLFAPNSGSARNAFLNDEVDAWITWIDWARSNPEYGEIVEIEKDLVVYRDVNIAVKKEATDEVKRFVKFLQSKEAEKIAEKYDWIK